MTSGRKLPRMAIRALTVINMGCACETGDWNPTLEILSNITDFTWEGGYYSRVGEIVHFGFSVLITGTATTSNGALIASLPVDSAFVDTRDAFGMLNRNQNATTTAAYVGQVYAGEGLISPGNRLILDVRFGTPNALGSNRWRGFGHYRVRAA